MTINSINGLKILFKKKSAQREFIVILATTILFVIEPSRYSFTLFILSVTLLAVESINTSIEIFCNHVTPDINTEIKQVKNLGAAAVFIISSLIVFVFILFLSKKFGFSDSIFDVLLKIKKVYLTKHAEYLFFIGTFIISLLLIERNKWIQASIFILLGIIWIAFHKSITTWLEPLGVDSFAELSKFDREEAIFYVNTIFTEIRPKLSFTRLLLYVISALVIYGVLKWIRKRLKFLPENFIYIKLIAAFFFINTALNITYGNSVQLLTKNSEDFLSIRDNFKNEPPIINFANSGIKLVVYIGESTSVMHMGLYGYPRNTTPQLSNLYREDDNFLVFKNVFSTHTHTTPSLLEALSFGVKGENNFFPIGHRKRTSLVDTLATNGIKTFLFSSQGQAGTWNQASSIVFKGSEKEFSTKTRLMGNDDFKLSKPSDHEFFASTLTPTIEKLSSNESSVIFLHSYAGHGPYLSFIPQEFKNPVDNFITTKNPGAIVGPNVHLINDIEAYDSAIKYIDFSVSDSIKKIKGSTEPIVFIYFSDHGESTYAGRGHDSSRFIHEMARVPFIIYFNDAAKKNYPELFEKYRNLAKGENISTLAQLPSTIVDLLGGQPVSTFFNFPNIIGDQNSISIPPIIVRETSQGYTYVSLSDDAPLENTGVFTDVTDSQTNSFVALKNNENKATKICYHRANTIGKALRGALVADCLEFDLVVEQNGTLSVYHPPVDSIDLSINEIVDIAKKNNLALWIDSKNINLANNCSELAKFLSASRRPQGTDLIEFPSNTTFNDPKLLNCSQLLINDGFRTSYYVPTDKVISCSKSLESGFQPSTNSDCKSLENDLFNAFNSKLFTDYSFDYGGIKAMEESVIAHKLRWNTWNVDPKLFNKINPKRFGMVILSNDDPNGR
jgi:glucan phosphoethanolaminetransferase (alkaline phosphatase superfamily)